MENYNNIFIFQAREILIPCGSAQAEGQAKSPVINTMFYQNYLEDNYLMCLLFSKIKVRKMAKIRNQYNRVPHLVQDTTWESDKITIRHPK